MPDFGDSPKIYYNGINQTTEANVTGKKIRENVSITIDFEDGNGDLGADAEERSSNEFTIPYQKRANWGYKANYELVTARKGLNGIWTESVLAIDSVKWMPILKPSEKQEPIKGKLDLNTSFTYGASTVPVTVKFKIRIIDRELHISNQIETDTIIVPAYL